MTPKWCICYIVKSDCEQIPLSEARPTLLAWVVCHQVPEPQWQWKWKFKLKTNKQKSRWKAGEKKKSREGMICPSSRHWSETQVSRVSDWNKTTDERAGIYERREGICMMEDDHSKLENNTKQCLLEESFLLWKQLSCDWHVTAPGIYSFLNGWGCLLFTVKKISLAVGVCILLHTHPLWSGQGPLLMSWSSPLLALFCASVLLLGQYGISDKQTSFNKEHT